MSTQLSEAETKAAMLSAGIPHHYHSKTLSIYDTKTSAKASPFIAELVKVGRNQTDHPVEYPVVSQFE